ncbi:MAG TPA: hypothetical protein VMY06_11645, partial [Sedimentisphaerales bacterium]|nr:hypothetical protein [Sedimentisphaerales bacterium]
MTKRTKLSGCSIIAVFLMAMACTAAGNVIYVDDDASLGGNGQNWATPYRYLQDALGAAVSGDEIRVAEGIYKPDEDSAHPNGTGSRTAAFQLKNGVAIKGGYAGFGQPDPDARDIEVYETVLSGDLLGNDGPDFANNYENSFHIVTGTYNDSTAVLDGFTVIAGSGDGDPELPYGGGMLSLFGSATLANCIFTGNSGMAGGGVCYLGESSPTLTNCTFTGNSAEIGGALVGIECNFTLTNCTFTGNSATINSAEPGIGGAIYHVLGTSTLNNCIFTDNSAGLGGTLVGSQCNFILTNCTFTGNSAEIGGAFFGMACTSTLTGCTFTGNSASQWGGAFYNESNNEVGSATLINCVFSANTCNYAGGAMHEAISKSSLYNCLFTGNSCSMYGGAIYSWYESRPNLFNCTFAGNSAPYGNAIACSTPEGDAPPSTVRVSNCIFWDGGGEIFNNNESTITITYSDIQGGYPGAGNINADPCFVDLGYSGPIAYWKLDEAGGTTATDSVGINDGTIFGA